MSGPAQGRPTTLWAIAVGVTLLLAVGAVGGVLVAAVVAPDGTASDPHEVANWTDLAGVTEDPAAHYVLVQDLDAQTDGYAAVAGPEADDGAGWAPIGADAPFTGTFDGRGHTVDGLHIDRPETSNQGLFAYIDGGVVRNLRLTDVDVTGANKVGALAGRNTGTIETSTATGQVTGAQRVGGLVGHNENAAITDSASRVEVVSAGEKIGGLVGDNSNAEIHRSYSAGVVDSADAGAAVGGLTGREDGDTVVADSFWDTEASGQSDSGGGTGKTTAELQTRATFTDVDATDGLTAAWDFVDDPNDDTAAADRWGLAGDRDGGYPHLTVSLPDPVTLTLTGPADGADDVPVPPTLSATVDSPRGASSDVTFAAVAGWDITTATDDGIAIDTEDTGPEGIHLSADGRRMYVMGYSDEEVYQFDLETAWDLSTATFDTSQENVDANSADLFVSPDGSRYYELEKADGEIHQMAMTAGDITSVDITARTTIATESSDPEDIHFSPDGTRLYELGPATIYEYTLSTPWDISTAERTDASVATQDSAATGLFLRHDGTRLYELGDGDDTLYQSTLSTPWDLSTASVDADATVALDQEDAHSLVFKPTGTAFYTVGRDAERAYSYSLDAGTEPVGTDAAVDSGTSASVSWAAADTLRYHEWVVTADDGTATTTSATRGFTTGADVAAVLEAVTVTSEPARLRYDAGDALELTGLAVTLQWDNGTTQGPIAADAFADAGLRAAPTNATTLTDAADATAVTITHIASGATATTAPLQVDPVVTGITVETEPATRTYTEGDALTLAGLVLEETRSDATTATVEVDGPGWANYTADPTAGTELTTADNATAVTLTHTATGTTATTAVLQVDPADGDGTDEGGSSDDGTDAGGDDGSSDDGTDAGGDDSSSSGGSSSTDDTDDAPPAVTTEAAADGSTLFTVAAAETVGPITLAPPAGSPPQDVTFERLTVRPTDAGARTFTVSVHQWDTPTPEENTAGSGVPATLAGADDPRLDPQAFRDETGAGAYGYTLVTHSIAASDVAGVTLRFGVSTARLDAAGIAPDAVTLYRAGADGWRALSAQPVDATDSHVLYEAEAPGLSVFVVGGPVGSVERIEVTRQPTLTYADGDGLDLRGMEVTETYSDGTTATTLAYADGGARTADRPQGTTLGVADDGQNITVTHAASGATAETAALRMAVDAEELPGGFDLPAAVFLTLFITIIAWGALRRR